MIEFDSVSVSSFDAASLSAVLTDKAADGWKVVAIIPAAADIVAYLQRSTVDEAAGVAAEAAEVVEEAPASAVSLTALDTTEAGKATVIAGATPDRSDDGGTGWAAGAAGAGATPASSTPASSTQTSSTSWGGSSQQAAATQPAATSQVPAGWYADPSRRYELRYWDGGNWTEHVSRAGQQYTDPPVA